MVEVLDLFNVKAAHAPALKEHPHYQLHIKVVSEEGLHQFIIRGIVAKSVYLGCNVVRYDREVVMVDEVEVELVP